MKHRILIVDDNEETRMLVSRMLTRANLEFNTAASAMECFEWIEKKEFTILLLDLILPGVDGFSVIRVLRNNPKWDDVYILVISAMRDKEHVMKALELGADDYVTKPLDYDVFMNKLKLVADEIDIRALPSYSVNPNMDYSRVTLDFDLGVKKISEHGIVFQADMMFNRGSVFRPSGFLMEEIGVEPPQLLVQNCTRLPEGETIYKYEIETDYFDVEDAVLDRIRRYIYIKTFGTDE